MNGGPGSVREVRVHVSEQPLVRPFVTAIRRAESIQVVLVEVIDDDGTSGWGEAAVSWRVTGESPESVRAVVDGVLGEVATRHPLDSPDTLHAELARVAVGNAAARSAVECAFWDLAATRSGRTLAAALGARRTRVRTDVTVSATSTDALVTEAVRHATDGFEVIKVKVGVGGDDREALVAAREALGSDIALRVDANQAWEVDEAVAILRFWESAGVGLELVEQPVAARDLAGMAAVAARVGTPVLADESVHTEDDLHEVIRRSAAAMVNLKLAKTGGIQVARRMAWTAAEHGIGVIVGCMMEGSVGVGSAAALAASLEGPDAARAHDLDAGLWQVRSPVGGGIRYSDGHVLLSPLPGLGVAAPPATQAVGGR